MKNKINHQIILVINHLVTPLAIILATTRDLAQQIYNDTNEFKKCMLEPVINLALCIGGGISNMLDSVRKCHIAIGTIGSWFN